MLGDISRILSKYLDAISDGKYAGPKFHKDIEKDNNSLII